MNDSNNQETNNPMDSGFDIGTSVEIYPEEMVALASELCGNIMKTLARWYVGVDYEAPIKNPEKTLFKRMVERQMQKAALHRARSAAGKMGGDKKQANRLANNLANDKQNSSNEPSKTVAKSGQNVLLKTKKLKTKILEILKRDISSGFSDSEPVEVAREDVFDAFWKLYPSSCPRKTDRKKCREKFLRLLTNATNTSAFVEELFAGLERWCDSEMWSANNGSYIKAPLVWLNNECWNDEPKPRQELEELAIRSEPTEEEMARMQKVKNIVEVGICK